jgi:hypothetical protein
MTAINWRCHLTLAAFLAAVQFPSAVVAQRPVDLAPNAPRDRPAGLTERCQWDTLVRTLDPYVRQARASYPAAKRRFLAGLPPGETFFVTVRLSDSLEHHEQVFVVVDSIIGDRIAGRLWSQVELVRGFHLRQPYVTTEPEIVDWLIAKPDGTEEGNIVGKFLDTYQPPKECRDHDPTG